MSSKEETMWCAVVDCDETYDGTFFYAVKTVGVYCRPSCKSRTPLRKNTLFFANAEEAQRAGMRACKRCRPDVFPSSPVANHAERALHLIEQHFCDRTFLTKELKQLGLSPNYLGALFKRRYGVSPMDYLNRRRAAHAKRLLAEGRLSILQVAGELGYESLSSFYAFFKKQTGATPASHRKNALSERELPSLTEEKKNV